MHKDININQNTSPIYKILGISSILTVSVIYITGSLYVYRNRNIVNKINYKIGQSELVDIYKCGEYFLMDGDTKHILSIRKPHTKD
jgi:hypothetical protein